MKNTIPILFSMFLSTCALAQEASLKVVASAGNTFTTPTMQIDCTIGESMIATIENQSTLISQGMHQPNYKITRIHDLTDELADFRVYPNPTTDYAEMQIKLQHQSEIEVHLIDASGRSLWSKQYDTDTIDDKLSLKDFPAGAYFISIRLNQRNLQHSFSLIKN